MSQELLGLQAHAVAVRLVQSVPQLQLAGMPIPSGPQVGPQTTVLGVPYVPSWVGVNGPRGFSEGTFELRLYEEGNCQIKFANAEGEDGVLHRRRLLITQAGKVVPTGGNVTTYQGGAFRPGDEFVEVYRGGGPGAPAKLLFICAVTKATLDSGDLTIQGSDALWLLKKQRETAAGFYVNAPRDVCEHYTKVWQPIVADDFPQDGRFNSSALASTADGLWQYDHAWNVAGPNWGPGLGSVVRLIGGTLRAAQGVPVAFQQQPGPGVRWEARVRMTPGTAGVTIGFGVGSGAGATPATWGYILMLNAIATSAGPVGTTQLFDPAGRVQTFQIPNFNATGWHTVAIEVRDRYIFGYVDGRLVGVIAQLGAVDNVIGSAGSTAAPIIHVTNSSGTVDVDYATLRLLAPGFLRPQAPGNLGDYQIGGAPAPGSALLEVWHTDDLPPAGTEFSPGRISQYAGKFTSPGVALGGAGGPSGFTPAWWPGGGGVYYSVGWAARATGAMYLTLGSYDYRFLMTIAHAGRLWVAKTRFGEQLIDNWFASNQSGHGASSMVSPYLKAATIGSTTLAANALAGATTITVASYPAGFAGGQLVRIGNSAPYEYAYVNTTSPVTLFTPLTRAHSIGEAVVIMNQGSLAAQPTGWYPFIMELGAVQGGASSAVGVLRYERSDQPGYWNVVGSSAYMHTIYAMVQKYAPTGAGAFYWPLNQGVVENGQSYDDTIHGNGTLIVASDGVRISTTPNTLAPGDVAPTLGGMIAAGRTDYIRAGNIPVPTSVGWTFATSVYTTSAATTQDILSKTLSVDFGFYTTGQFFAQAYNGATWDACFGGSYVAGQWYHLVVTWDGSTLRLYVNGAQVASVAHTAQATNANDMDFGGYNNIGTTNGSAAHVLMLPAAMSAADVSALYQAASSAPHVPISQAGIVDSTQQPYRYVSHYDQLLQTIKDWGLQTTAEPMQLESGEFPGRIRALVRVGRDTEYKVGSPQVRLPTASDLQDEITAEDVCDALISDAQGLADPSGAAQIAAEVFNFSDIMAVVGGSSAVPLHPWISSEYEQSNDVAYPDLLVQRLVAMLALRGSPWEQVSLNHRPERQIVDTFPLTGQPAEFSWGPGDGVRLDLPELGLVDQSPRQVLGVQWPFTPGGLGAPAISLRQRPRNFAQVLRDMFRTALSGQRSYQGQLSPVIGSMGAGGGAGGAADAYSRVPIPMNQGNVARAILMVVQKSDASSWQVEVNGSTTGAPTFTRAGPIDITNLFGIGSTGAPVFYVRCLGGTGNAQYFVQLFTKT